MRSHSHGLEAAAVNRRRPVPIERLVMLRRAVALVGGEAVAAGRSRPARHHFIARHLREYRGGTDAGAQRIAVDDRFERAIERQARERRTAIAVDLHVRRTHAQSHQRAAHRQVRRLAGCSACRFPRRRPMRPTRPAQRARILIASSARSSGSMTFESRMPRMRRRRIENDGRRDHRSGQRTATRFIDARAAGRRVPNRAPAVLNLIPRAPPDASARDSNSTMASAARAARVAPQRLVYQGESLHELIAIGTLQLLRAAQVRARQPALRRLKNSGTS